MKQDQKLGAVLLAIALVFGAVIGWHLHPTPEPVHTRDVEVVRDTVTQYVEREPITITKARTVVVRDTLVVVEHPEPFAYTATLDTITRKRDTVRVVYEYPQHTLSVLIRNAPDTIRTERLTVYVTKQVPAEGRAWYVDALGIIGAGALGYVGGRLAP